jgi:hypothetical protein
MYVLVCVCLHLSVAGSPDSSRSHHIGLARAAPRCYRVLHSIDYGVTEYRLWCYRVEIMVLQSIYYGVTEYISWRQRAAVMVLESNGCGVSMESDGVLQSVTDVGVRWSVTALLERRGGECYRVLQIVTECYRLQIMVSIIIHFAVE